MPDRVPFQIRADRELHERVAYVAERLHLNKNAAYQMLLELGIGALVDLERAQHPVRIAKLPHAS